MSGEIYIVIHFLIIWFVVVGGGCVYYQTFVDRVGKHIDKLNIEVFTFYSEHNERDPERN